MVVGRCSFFKGQRLLYLKKSAYIYARNFFNMKRIVILYIIVFFGLAAGAQNVTKVLQDIENYKIITLPNGFKVQVVTSEEFKHCNCRLTVNVADIDEQNVRGIKQVVASMTGSDLISNEIIVKNMISHNQALDSLMEFLSGVIYTEKFNSVSFDDYKLRRTNYLKAENAKPYKKTSDFADLKTGTEPLQADFMNSVYESDYKNYKTFCFSPDRCLLTVLSNMQPSDIEALATKYFGSTEKQMPPVKPVTAEIKAKDIIYFINDTILSDVAGSFRNYFACQKTPKNYILNKLLQRLLYGDQSHSAKDFSTFNYDIYSLDFTQKESSFEEFAQKVFKPRNSDFEISTPLQKAKTEVVNDFNKQLLQPDFATEIASYLVLYKFPNNYFTSFDKNVNAVTESEAQNFIKLINKNGCNVFVFNGNQEKIHCAVINFTGERQLDIVDFEGNTFFSFEKGFSAQTIFDKYLTATGLNEPPKSFSVNFSSNYKYTKTGAEYAASGRILRKLPNMYMLENFIIHTDSSKVFHYKEAYDGQNAFDSTKLYGMEEIDSLRFNVLKQKAFFPLEAHSKKLGQKSRLACDYKTFKDSLFKIETTDLNHQKTYTYYNMQNGLKEKTEILDGHGYALKTIFYEYSENGKYLLPVKITEKTFETETEINFSSYDFSAPVKKSDFVVGQTGKKKKTK